MSREAMKLALEALKELVAQTETGLFAVQHDHVAMNDARQAITALREALAQQALDKKAENARELGLDYESAQQEPVAWLTEERYAEMHSSKWSPKIQQIFNKDGTLESQTIQYTPQSIPAPYPLAQRTWVGLTEEETEWCDTHSHGNTEWMKKKAFARAIEAKLKEKNT